MIGVVWAIWHLPLFLLDFDMYAGGSFAVYLPPLVGLAVVYTVLWDRSRGSVLVAMVMHAAVNASAALIPVAEADSVAVDLGLAAKATMGVTVLALAAAQAPRVAAFVTDRLLRECLTGALRAGGLAVRSAPAHPPEAGCAGRADVSVVDAGAPGGLALLRQVRDCPACGARPVIALLTFPDDEQRRRVLAAGADAVALKRDADGVATLARRLADPPAAG